MTPELDFVKREGKFAGASDIWTASCGYFHFVIGFGTGYEAVYWIKNYIPHIVDGSPFQTLDQATAACEIMLQKLANSSERHE